MFNLHTAAEKSTGTLISEDEYRQALPTAQRKLEYINNLNGTHYGESYLASLIAEAVEARRLTRYLDTVNKTVRRSGLE